MSERCEPTREPYEGKMIGGCGRTLIEQGYRDKHGKPQTVTICRHCDGLDEWPGMGKFAEKAA
jgi:hypothetical protein